MGCGTSKEETLAAPVAKRFSSTDTSMPPTQATGETPVESKQESAPLSLPQVHGELPEDSRIIFVLGGPGSGKGTQCDRIVAKYGYKHLSAGDLLRAEVKSGSELGKQCEALMKEGKLVPQQVTIALLKNEMVRSGAREFLIDGFPRALDQAFEFEKQIKPCESVLFFDCPEATMEERLLKRGETSGRSDDNIATIKKRFTTFIEQSLPVVEYYEKQGKAHKISAVPPPAEVFEEVSKILGPAPPATLQAAPIRPEGKILVVEARGGSDKGADGHRRDTIPICNALRQRNWDAYPIFYSDADYEATLTELKNCDGFMVRVNPGKYEGITQSLLEKCLKEAAAAGNLAMSHPDVMRRMGAKDALVKIANLSCGMADTYAYYDIPSFKENFPKTIATGVRVVKQNRGSQGEGIWVVKVLDPSHQGEVTGDTMLHCQEAVDNHVEERTLDDFMTFCEQYIVGDEGQLIDQRFLPRIVEGELRLNMIYDKPTEIVHKKPAEGGISATLASGAKYVSYSPEDAQFKVLIDNFINKDLPQVMATLGMSDQPLPIVWTSDFILGDKDDAGNDTYFVGEFNCSCVGITQQLHLAAPVADAVIRQVKEHKAHVLAAAPEAGPVVLLAQPEAPKGKIVVVEARGGSDKGADGHRRDTIPICNALIQMGWTAYPIFYADQSYSAVLAELMTSDGFMVRVNPGKYEGITQSLLEKCLKEAAAAGKLAMSHPDVMRRMGAKDALVKIANLSCGMADTYAYYDIPSFKESFPKTIATGVRVLKQNRGSQGEGIWVVKVLDPSHQGEVTGSTMLHCQEAVDNHVEERTLDDFMAFCEQYIVGDEGQLIDQRFLPRIVEGELRLNMIYDKPTEIVHKKPAEGGISATLASGAKYVSYPPDDPQFAVLIDNFINKDLPQVMTTLGMSDQPLPVLWTSDFILGEKDDAGNDTYLIGEFNCSCVGITQQLHLATPVAEAMIKIVTDAKARQSVVPAAVAVPEIVPDAVITVNDPEAKGEEPEPAATSDAPEAEAQEPEPVAAADAPEAEGEEAEPAASADAPEAGAEEPEPVAAAHASEAEAEEPKTAAAVDSPEAGAEEPKPAASHGPAVLLPQPESPKGSIVVVEAPGGSDKGADGHRRDTIPICNALIERGWAAKSVFYTDADAEAVAAELAACDGFVVRVNPGKYEGITQSKLEKCLKEAAATGKPAMSHPDVMRRMGAKDALVKIANLSCGMADTYAYYDIATFKESFPKTIASGVRVLKQNRGSQGEGIWVVKVLDPSHQGEVTGDTMLHCQEAVDNHIEERTLDDFMTFCEQYIVGDEGQLIDQRFLPRIVEGELRVNMIYDKPTEIVHKKPAEGGISATLASGAKYVSYPPDDPQFAVLIDNFINKDLPQVMTTLGMSDQPLPVLWTSDFILGEKDDAGNDTYLIGEFNCSCVGITQQLHLAGPVADAVIKIVSEKQSA